MSSPAFYDPSRCGVHFPPDNTAAADAGRKRGLPAASKDSATIALMLDDMPIDFIPGDGAHSVSGVDIDVIAEAAYQRLRERCLAFTVTTKATG
jgi:hypothetical protein